MHLETNLAEFTRKYKLPASKIPADVLEVSVIDSEIGFLPHLGTMMMALVLCDLVKPGMKVFEVGTGTGLLAVVAAKLGAEVSASDTDEESLAVARENAKLNQVEIDFKDGYLAEPIADTDNLDIIFFNLPSSPTNPTQTSDAHSSGGADGRFYIDEMIKSLPDVTRKSTADNLGTRVLTIQSHLSDYQKTREQLEELGARTEVMDWSLVPLGATSLAQAIYIKENLPDHTWPLIFSAKYFYELVVISAQF
jgi:release factor glutamine methyltransferase